MKTAVIALFTVFAGSVLQTEGAISFSINPVHVGGSGPSPTLPSSTWTLTFTLPQPATYSNLPPVGVHPVSAMLVISGTGAAGIDGTYPMAAADWILAPNQAGSPTDISFLLTAPFTLSGANAITSMSFNAFLDTTVLETAGSAVAESDFLNGQMTSGLSSFEVDLDGSLERYSIVDGSTVIPEPSAMALAGMAACTLLVRRRQRCA